MSELNEQVATQLRKAADKVDDQAMRAVGRDEYYDEGDGNVLVPIKAMKELQRALNRCLGKSAFYADEN